MPTKDNLRPTPALWTTPIFPQLNSDYHSDKGKMHRGYIFNTTQD